ncbi:MAG: PhzF family phenazine biosynthesis protein [Rubrobacter sp.]|jgi:trans-2,3-dihydro-3-hydroxyanthranilate isomerase|nr:PhzF family phenazine biosynthesis protein [Rubrobacter sp.]
MSLPFFIVDVFAERKYAGNQLAVLLEAGGLSGDEMQAITREFGFSETSFVLSREARDGGYPVRIFTPGGEVPFAGHPTLGTAAVIHHELLSPETSDVSLDVAAGRIPVTLGDILWMRQLPPTFGDTLDSSLAAPALSLEQSDLDERHPIQTVSTGLPAILIPLENLDALKRCRLDRERYRELAEVAGSPNLYAFCPEPHEAANDLAARMFADDLGVSEDPATGSAAGCLAAYLAEHRYLGDSEVDARLEQGYEIGRPSLLHLRAEKSSEGTTVHVGGKVRMVARGELL